jgi:hypothetical protein
MWDVMATKQSSAATKKITIRTVRGKTRDFLRKNSKTDLPNIQVFG